MDIWLTDEELNRLTQELNGINTKPKEYDSNWEKLKQERTNPFDTCVKTQTPTLYKFEKHNSFGYRRFDGAHWHREYRNLANPPGLTREQRQIKDNLDTILALLHKPSIKWHTPVTKQGDYDPRYQLLETTQGWLCLIGDCAYSVSNTKQGKQQSYTEHTFSTKQKPVFDFASLESELDFIMT